MGRILPNMVLQEWLRVLVIFFLRRKKEFFKKKGVEIEPRPLAPLAGMITTSLPLQWL